MRLRHLACSALSLALPLALARAAHADPPAAAPSVTPATAPATPIAAPFEHYRLSNGLDVVLQPDHRTPTVAIHVLYRVGFANDPPGLHGIAHLFEHLMFDGSRHVGRQEFHRRLDDVGADGVNATTTADGTYYTEEVPSDQLPLALWLESDRLAFLLDRLDARTLEEERRVVLSEYRARVTDVSVGIAPRVVYESLYPPGHPYRIAGDVPEDLAAIDLPSLQWFFQRYYRPDNATLVLVGDFEPGAARAQIEQYFGPIVAPPAPPAPEGAAPRRAPGSSPVALEGQRDVTVRASAGLERILVAWPTPPLYSRDDLALDLAAWILARGETARLVDRLVARERLAFRVEATEVSYWRESAFTIEAVGTRGASADALLRSVDAELARLRSEPLSDAEVADAQRGIELELAQADESAAGRATSLAHCAALTGDPGCHASLLARYRALTARQVRHAILRWLAPTRRVVVRVVSDPSAPYEGMLARRAHGRRGAL